MKKSGMAKMQAMKLSGKMQQPGAAAAFGQIAPVVMDRREQRKLDQSLGLIPFAVKLNSDLVQQIQTLAIASECSVNELVAELLTQALAAQ
ncbi:MAG: hypothetical protein H7240_03015 [Glaciimonas sp.]|nr:hypothetical protein [Glaciimonas sp.]